MWGSILAWPVAWTDWAGCGNFEEEGSDNALKPPPERRSGGGGGGGPKPKKRVKPKPPKKKESKEPTPTEKEMKDFEECVKKAAYDYNKNTSNLFSNAHRGYGALGGVALAGIGFLLGGPPGGVAATALALTGAGASGVVASDVRDSAAESDEAEKFQYEVENKCAKNSPNAYRAYKAEFNQQSSMMWAPNPLMQGLTAHYPRRVNVAGQLNISVALGKRIFPQ
jgi:hypothetical protein